MVLVCGGFFLLVWFLLLLLISSGISSFFGFTDGNEAIKSLPKYIL